MPCGNPQPLSADATCADANNATVEFRWAPLAGPNGNQFIDIGQDGNFPAGQYRGAGPIQSGVSSYKWSNIKTNVLYYYRINQQQSDGTWKASPVKSFTPRCGANGSAIAAAQANFNPDMYGSNDRLLVPGLATGPAAAPPSMRRSTYVTCRPTPAWATRPTTATSCATTSSSSPATAATPVTGARP